MKNPAGALTKSVRALKPRTAIDTTRHPGILTDRPKVVRTLPPAELKARRTRKRNQLHTKPPA